MPRSMTLLVLLAGAFLIAGAAALWLERGNAMLLDLSSSVSSFMCL
ncbi:hypothetical protein [Dichotomicrobium thermohalophilum]|uniref:Uncharacterized protein n=1 Tax=Dichotomicrobium thermohalophilum TaxID=933063 RepID=A0A397QBI3_9HYPH|nr:hypothetical protein [Dichotomicrobium thermohalophilum]RIA55464.1 hypothetical protein BXY53_0530 [Dichotomicrobium thermohalophilum]